MTEQPLCLVGPTGNWGSELPEQLSDWTDIDGSQFIIGQALGLFPGDPKSFNEHKGVFWTDAPVGNLLVTTLTGMVNSGILEYRDEPDHQFRWNADDD